MCFGDGQVLADDIFFDWLKINMLTISLSIDCKHTEAGSYGWVFKRNLMEEYSGKLQELDKTLNDKLYEDAYNIRYFYIDNSMQLTGF